MKMNLSYPDKEISLRRPVAARGSRHSSITSIQITLRLFSLESIVGPISKALMIMTSKLTMEMNTKMKLWSKKVTITGLIVLGIRELKINLTSCLKERNQMPIYSTYRMNEYKYQF